MNDITTQFTDIDVKIQGINTCYENGEIEDIYVFIETKNDTRSMEDV